MTPIPKAVHAFTFKLTCHTEAKIAEENEAVRAKRQVSNQLKNIDAVKLRKAKLPVTEMKLIPLKDQ